MLVIDSGEWRASHMANGAKVIMVKHDYEADYKVYFVDHDYQEQNAEILSGAELVSHDYQANMKVFIVQHDYQADIRIMPKNFPR